MFVKTQYNNKKKKKNTKFTFESIGGDISIHYCHEYIYIYRWRVQIVYMCIFIFYLYVCLSFFQPFEPCNFGCLHSDIFSILCNLQLTQRNTMWSLWNTNQSECTYRRRKWKESNEFFALQIQYKYIYLYQYTTYIKIEDKEKA